MPRSAVLGASSDAQGKPVFANAAREFANRVASLPGLALYPAGAAAAILLVTLAGAFGTGAMPFLQRLAFWTLLISVHTALWVCWFAWRVRKPSDWWAAVLLGGIVVNLALPLEIKGALRLVGLAAAVDWRAGWTQSVAISAAILLIVATAMTAFRRPPFSAASKGRLWRAGFRNLDDVASIAAEDHYCRVWHVNGLSRLVYGRFSDLVEEVAALDGAIVRRGHWVSASAVRSIERNGRNWKVELGNGHAIRIASSSVAELRRRGWLTNGGAISPPDA